MAVQRALCYVGTLFLASLPATQQKPQCGVINFETPNLFDGVLTVKETARVDVIFTARDRKCSTPKTAILVLNYQRITGVYMIYCYILPSCAYRPAISNISCSCLETPGFYKLTFNADRSHSGTWEFSVQNSDIKDISVTLNIIYPSHVTRLEIVGYNSYIPRHRFVTVVCSWEKGNPSSVVRLLGRDNSLLDKGDNIGNMMSYTFSRVECNHAGVIRCEADGSDTYKSINMLIQCPPEFVKNHPTIKKLAIGQNAVVTFPFRSHTLNVTSCHINQLTHDRNAGTLLIVVLNCTKSIEKANTSSHKNKYCLYSVTGVPPDLLLSLRVGHVTRQDSGLWHVTLSNDEGSDEIPVQVNIDWEMEYNQTSSLFVIVGPVLEVAVFAVFVYVIVYYFKRGKSPYARLKRKRKVETVVYRGLGTDTVDFSEEHSQRESEIYCEIQDSQLDSDLQPTAPTISVDVIDFPSKNDPHSVDSKHDVHLKRVGYLQSSYEEITSVCSVESAYAKQIQLENPRTSQDSSDYLQPIQTESQKTNVVPMSDYLKLVQTGNETDVLQQRSEYLKLIHTRNETTNTTEKSDYFVVVQTESETSNANEISDYLTVDQTESETSNANEISDYLTVVQTESETSNANEISNYLTVVQTESETSNENKYQIT